MTGLDIRIPGILIVMAIPLVLGIVPPNPLYGIHTQATLSSRAVWHSANRPTGIAVIVAMLASLAIQYVAAQWPTSRGSDSEPRP